jgi:hypothetical protein
MVSKGAEWGAAMINLLNGSHPWLQDRVEQRHPAQPGIGSQPHQPQELEARHPQRTRSHRGEKRRRTITEQKLA